MPSHKLSKPVKLENGTELTTIEIDEPTLGGLAQHEMTLAETGSSVAAMIAMLSVETGHPVSTIRKIKASDFEAVAGLVLPFLPGEPSGGSGDPSPPTSPSS